MALSQLSGSWGSYLPLNQPLMQVPLASPRAIRQDEEAQPGLPRHRFTQEQVQALISRFPPSFLSSQYPQLRRMLEPPTTPASTTTSTTTTTTTTTTTPRPAPLTRPPRRRVRPSKFPRFVSQFNYGGLEGREDYQIAPREDDAVVLLVGLFNLLAVVVYAANKYVSGDREGLSDRVIQWQVQKVLDELVIKVHSSQYMANLLSRAMPEQVAMVDASGRRVDAPAPPPWLSLLHKVLASASGNGTDATLWLQQAKSRLMSEIASSPAAMSTVRLHPRIYQPLKKFYGLLATKDGLKTALRQILSADGSPMGRGLASAVDDLPAFFDTLSQMDLEQVESTLRALTVLGRAQQRMDVLPALASAMKVSRASPSGRQARVISESDHYFPEALAQSLRRSRASLRSSRRQPRPLAYDDAQGARPHGQQYNYSDDSRYGWPSAPSAPNSPQPPVQRRMGVVEDESSVGGSGHWTDRWFSLVTAVSPVGLDMTTLYARARARPSCLRALLCRANNAWRQVGPVQAALTPFASVLLSWALEDTSPHSLGDSLIAVRAGWMGKDCSLLYPECPLQPDPHPAAKEAITFFSRLQFAATQAPSGSRPVPSGTRPDSSESPSGPRPLPSGSRPFPSGPRPSPSGPRPSPSGPRPSPSGPRPAPSGGRPQPSASGPSHESNNIHDRMDDNTLDRGDFRPTTSRPQYEYDHAQPMATNSPRPAHNYRLPEHEGSPRRPYPAGEANDQDPAATVQAYYHRYGGQGPMTVPGSDYSSKYGQVDEADKGGNNDHLYEKYDSPDSSSAAGEISESNSVSGMALQDRPTGNSPQVWEKFFKAGLYGANVHHTATPNQKESSSEDQDPSKSTRFHVPPKRQQAPPPSLNKMGTAMLTDKPAFHNFPGYANFMKNNNNNNNNKGPSKARPTRRPYFALRPNHMHSPTPRTPSNGPPSSALPHTKKYKYGLRRGLPAGNVNGYNAYINNRGNLYQRQKPWYAYTTHPQGSMASAKVASTTATTTTTTTTTPNPLASKDVAPFGPEDAVTDVLRNELLFEYIRDRQGSIPIDDKRSMT